MPHFRLVAEFRNFLGSQLVEKLRIRSGGNIYLAIL
ncbi:hypothetical protein DSM3645_02663 [Blastopirellula marina DSM 3645]|uniref:Uncharacterized protein n=1 Tax=Blastopirellula marina DSM 3645 TaxID=314230 RepID=A3ZVJ6_9BACT|nr:hypothetical protein DSM3645_02663 [Blastopirellula marina DSM 3645]